MRPFPPYYYDLCSNFTYEKYGAITLPLPPLNNKLAVMAPSPLTPPNNYKQQCPPHPLTDDPNI